MKSVVLLAAIAVLASPASAQNLRPAHPLQAAGHDAAPSPTSSMHRVNIIDGEDGRDSLLAIGPSIGLSAAEIARIRAVSGYVGCFLPSPSVGTGALFLNNRQILTAGHIFFDRATGQRRSKCFFKTQAVEPVMIDIDASAARFGAEPPKAGSNSDWAVVGLVAPVPGAEPFPVAPDVPVRAGDALIEITAHPAGMEREMDNAVPVAQACSVRRAPISTGATSFFRTDCDATGSSSGGMHLARLDGRLVFRGITITTGPWQDPAFRGAPYGEEAGSVTTALGTDAAILEAGRALAGE